MGCALLVMTDGRFDLLDRTLQSLDRLLVGPVDELIINCDTGDPDDGAYLRDRYRDWTVCAGDRRRGYSGAMRHAWHALRAGTRASHVVHWEDDFTLLQPFDLAAAIAVLDRHPHVAQMALRRQAWYPNELDAGGILEAHPGSFTETRDGEQVWLEHRRWFTTNPCIYRRSLLRVGWPNCEGSEDMFTRCLLAGGTPEAKAEDVRFGYWGAADSGVWVEHTGAQRAGTGY